jgi:hypothetical protein
VQNFRLEKFVTLQKFCKGDFVNAEDLGQLTSCNEVNRKKRVAPKKSDFPCYEKNPYESILQSAIRKGRKTFFKGKAKGFNLQNNSTGEIHEDAVFGTEEDVDVERFVKLYVKGIKALCGLPKGAMGVFEALLMVVSNTKGMNEIHFSFQLAQEKYNYNHSRQSFLTGVNQLLKADFIRKSKLDDYYYVNPQYIFNGNRISFVQTFKLIHGGAGQS